MEQKDQELNYNSEDIHYDDGDVPQVKEQENVIQNNEEDKRSIFIQNVDYGTTKEELKKLFQDCGEIEKITIPQSSKGSTKGFAYIQFESKSSVELSIQLSDSILRGRTIKVLPKRTNLHGFNKKQQQLIPKKGRNSFNSSSAPSAFMQNNLIRGFMLATLGFKKAFNPH